jgi:hypothetical protein
MANFYKGTRIFSGLFPDLCSRHGGTFGVPEVVNYPNVAFHVPVAKSVQ